MTNNEIVIALRSVAEKYKGKFVATFETNINAMATDAADHIERLCEENNFLKAEIKRLKDILYDDDGVNLVNYWHQQCKIAENGCKNFAEENESQKAEIKRLKKKDNEWALSYVNSVAMGIREREEAIKKFAEKVEDVLAPTVSALFCISETLVEASKQHISPEEALKNIRVQLSEKQPICSKLQLEEVLDRHVKAMED